MTAAETTSAHVCTPPAPSSRAPRPAHSQAHGRLMRAIVTLPRHMTTDGRSLQERWVFFDAPSVSGAGERLAQLLAPVWNIDTVGWANDGSIYNLEEASELIRQNEADDDTALFECEWGKNGTKHVAAEDVDYFCTPRVRARLEAAHRRALGQEGGAA